MVSALETMTNATIRPWKLHEHQGVLLFLIICLDVHPTNNFLCYFLHFCRILRSFDSKKRINHNKISLERKPLCFECQQNRYLLKGFGSDKKAYVNCAVEIVYQDNTISHQSALLLTMLRVAFTLAVKNKSAKSD